MAARAVAFDRSAMAMAFIDLVRLEH